ncbi:cysteine--tRNA ligase [Candidatus Woesearchaeota archaeon]|nr:cysteine--tRNA ligase [Candidatus Woesearchaeota archaeon]
MALKFTNTMSRKKEEFIPLEAGKAGLYTCGPTVYNYPHLGNLRCYVFVDVLKRVLVLNGLQVKHVMNITDVGHLTSDADEGEDKMEKGAAREGKSVWDIATFYTDAFKSDITALNILHPDVWCKATEHIKEQIEQVQTLVDKGYTYTTSDGVYFDTSKIEGYGALARLKVDELEGGKRVDLGEKKNKTDFALWKFSPTDVKRQMEWDSPFGRGFPGWHIECSSMSTKYLGEQFDIHCGGIDHIPVHHPNEIAQAEGATGKKPWVKYWLHNEFLVMNEEKMAKSSDGFLRLQTVFDKGYSALDFRYFCLSAVYRMPLQFSWEAMDGAKQSLERLKKIVLELKAVVEDAVVEKAEWGKKAVGYEEEFVSAVSDDLNTPQGLAVLWNVLRDKELKEGERLSLVGFFDSVLGLGLADVEEEVVEVPSDVRKLIDAREEARKNKDWVEADRLRLEVMEKGFSLSDTKEGVKVRRG